MERRSAYRETGFADIMRALLLLAALHVCAAAAADVIPTQRDMQRAVLIDRDLDEVERYLQAGFDPRSAIGCGTFDVMDGAVQIQNPDMVALLLRYGVHPKESTFVQAALLPSPAIAVKIVDAFLRAGADANAKIRYPQTKGYWTALHFAVARQNVELVRLLVSQQGIALNDIDGDGQTALGIARDKADSAIVTLLLRAGASPSG